jgi:capsular exopolysaccharide synthesis family protein
MEAVDQEVAKRVDSVRGRLRQDYSASMNTEQMLKQQYDAQTTKAYALNRKQAEYAVLLAEAKSNQDLYDTLQYKLQQAGVDAGLNGVNTMIVDKARVPLRPIKPKKMLILSFGLLLGLFAGVGASFLKEAITDNVHSAEQIERSVGYFLIAGIPKFVAAPAESKTEGSTQLAPKLVSYLAPQSRDAEAYRSLRNNVLLSALDHPYKSILITSSLPSEGKSTVASNYAIVLAQRGARVLAIDADLRRPRLHQLMGLTNETGLSDLLIGEVRSGAFKQPFRDLPNLSVLTAGRKVALPSEALGSHQLRTMIEGWKNQFDVIVLDSAPILAVSDTLPLTSYMEAVILVARFDQTPIRALRRTRDMLSRTHANVVGVVMNQVSELASSYGGYYGYGEYYE